MQWVRTVTPQPQQNKLYWIAITITLAGNVILAASKAVAAYLSGSVALYADAANSISDVVYSLMMVFGLWVSMRPPDLSHPQGHSRFDPLVAMLVTFAMTFAGFQAAREAVERFLAGGGAVELGLPVLILLFSMIVKLGMFLSIRRIGNQVSSPTLRTTAVDHLADILTSAAAFLGILGSNWIHPLLDPIAGLIVAAWIFRAAFLAARNNLGYLTGQGASEEFSKQLLAAAESVPGVIRVHHLMAEYVGPALVVDLHVNVDAETPLRRTHAISDQVSDSLKAFPEVDRVYVHIEPHDWQD